MGFDEILRIVLNKDKERKTDWIAYVKNEQYAEKYFKSLELVQKALLVFPGDADLLQLKAKAELNSNNSQEALITMKQAVKLHPDNEEVLNYKNSLESDLSFNTLSIDYSLEVYQNKDRDHMHYTTVQYARQTKYGSINAKINYTNRFLTDNYQLEIDLYPRIVKGLYAYVSGGWSQSPLNPSARYGAELFKSLPKSFEASLGFRWLKFSTETTIYTGSLGWYTGNSYWALRSYVTPGFPGTSASGRLIYRKYRSDAQNYLNVEIGYGASPAVDRFVPNSDGIEIKDSEIFRLDSQSINFGYFLTSKSKKNIWGFTTGVFREEKPFAKGEYFLFGSFGVSYGVRFK